MKRILFIGGGGFIGSNIISDIDGDSYEAHVVEPMGANLSRLDGMDVIIHRANISDIDVLTDIIDTNYIDILVHLVSTLIPGSSFEDYKKEYKNIIFPSIELMEICAKRHIKFVFFSSGGTVYGSRNLKSSFKESDELAPISYYGWSKQIMENSILFKNRTEALDYLILRPSNPYGHGQNLHARQGLIAVAIGCMLDGKPLEIWGDGSAVRDYIYIKDLVNVFWKLIDNKVINTTLNIGSGEGYSVNEILDVIMAVSHQNLKISYKNSRCSDVSYMVLDNSNLKRYVEVPMTPIDKGIEMFYKEMTKN